MSYLFAANETTFAYHAMLLQPTSDHPKLLHLSPAGEVTRYFTLFFELDSFPLAIITTSFGPCPGTDAGDDGVGGGWRPSS